MSITKKIEALNNADLSKLLGRLSLMKKQTYSLKSEETSRPVESSSASLKSEETSRSVESSSASLKGLTAEQLIAELQRQKRSAS